MEVPEGANLRFDRPLDLNKGGIGRLIEGQLRGPVRSAARASGPTIRTTCSCRPTTSISANSGSPRPATSISNGVLTRAAAGRWKSSSCPAWDRDGNQEGPNIGGIEQFHSSTSSGCTWIWVRPRPPRPGRAGHRGAKPAGPPMLGALLHGGPLEITCRGPFCFRLIEAGSHLSRPG